MRDRLRVIPEAYCGRHGGGQITVTGGESRANHRDGTMYDRKRQLEELAVATEELLAFMLAGVFTSNGCQRWKWCIQIANA